MHELNNDTEVTKATICTGADPGFFLGGGAPVRNGVTDIFCRIPVVLESRRSSQGGAHPLHPPPRSAPAVQAL